MSGRWIGFIAALSCVLPGSAAEPQQAEPQAATLFRSSVDLVSVTAVVRDRKGRFVRDLAKTDFTVAEGGEPRRILDFQSLSDGPVKIALVVDVSGSMRVGPKAVNARQAARHLFSALRPTDQAALFAFDTRVAQVSGFTSDVATLDAAFGRVDPPYGQTSLYDAVAETARLLEATARQSGQRQQRSAVVVLTDGLDTRSRMTPEQVSAIASNIDVPVYILAVMASIDDPQSDASLGSGAGVDAARGLRSLAQWTGGELFTASAPAHASMAARQIVDELRHQYVLAFEAGTRSGWRPLEVRARDRGLVVRARAGYSAGGQT